MKSLLIEIGKVLLKLLIAVAILSLVCVLIWHFFGLAITKAFLYLGVACMVIGALCASGNSSISANASSSYMMNSKFNYGSNDKMAKDFLDFRNSSLAFTLFLIVVGGILIGIMAILRKLGL